MFPITCESLAYTNFFVFGIRSSLYLAMQSAVVVYSSEYLGARQAL